MGINNRNNSRNSIYNSISKESMHSSRYDVSELSDGSVSVESDQLVDSDLVSNSDDSRYESGSNS